MTPSTSPGPGVASAHDGTAGDGAASGGAAPGTMPARGSRALLLAGAVVAAVAAVAYLVALVTHPLQVNLDGFDLQVYLGGAHEALHKPANLYSWHYRNDLGIQFTYTPFAALVFMGGLGVPFRSLLWLVSLASIYALAATVWIAFREFGWRSLPARLAADRQPSSRKAIHTVAASANVLASVTSPSSAVNGSASPAANSSAANGV